MLSALTESCTVGLPFRLRVVTMVLSFFRPKAVLPPKVLSEWPDS